MNKTRIIGFEYYSNEDRNVLIPIVECEPRTDMPEGLRFWCSFCKKYHLHGEGEGHRWAHCHNEKSPFNKTGYILQLKKSLEVRR